MNINAKTYFTTGELAKLLKVKKQTLFHYDEIGLLHPDLRDANNYRYYNPYAFELFFVIEALQDTGMSLAEIRMYLQEKSPQRLITLLNTRIHVIEQRINRLQQIKRYAECKLSTITQKMNFDSVQIEYRPEEYVITSQHINESSGKNFARHMMDHINYCQNKGLGGMFSVDIILDQQNVVAQKYEEIKFLYTRLMPEQISLANNVIPAGDHIFAFHRGDWTLAGSLYQKIISHIQNNNLLLIGDFYEQTLLDDISVDGYEHYVYKISARIAHTL